MSYPQTYYTSCEKGLAATGFQYNAITPGISTAVLSDLTRISGYMAPLSAPHRPTEEEIALFPLALTFARFRDDTVVVGQTRYTGQDYTARFGNYFAHFAVLSDLEKLQKDFHPIELWRSPTWTTTQSDTTDLPPLDSLELGGTIDFDAIVAFLSEGDRLNHYEQMLTAALLALNGSGRRLILVDDNDAVAQWIAALSFALPPELAWRLTFTTYAKNPANVDVLIVGTTSDSDFSFSSMAINHQYAVFDFVGGRFSEFSPEPFALYVVAAFRQGAGAKIADFGRFVATAGLSVTAPSLATAFLAYSLYRDFGVGSAAAVSDLELAQWCTQNPAVLSEGLVSRLLNRLNLAELVANPQSPQILREFYESVRSMRFVQNLYPQFITWLLNLMPEGDLEGLEALARSLAAQQSLTPADNTAAAERYVQALERIAASGEALRLCRVAVIGDAFGWSEAQAERITQSAKVALEPVLSAPGSPSDKIYNSLAGAGGSAAGTALLRGVLPLLNEYASDSAKAAVLRPLLTQPATVETLWRLAQLSGYYRLIGYLTAIHVDAAMPENRFHEITKAMEEVAKKFAPADYDFVYQLVWGAQPPDTAQGVWILRELSKKEPQVLTDTAILTKVAQSQCRRLDAQEDLTNLSGDERDLLDILYGWTQKDKTSLGDSRFPVLALAYRCYMRDLSPDKAVSGAWQIAAQVADPSKSHLLTAASQYLLELADKRRHEELLLAGVDKFGKSVSVPYAEALRDALDKKNNIKELTHFARIWITLTRQKRKSSLELIGDEIAAVYYSLSNDERSMVDLEIGRSDPALRKLWLEEIKARAGVKEKIKDMFSKFRRK